jgi:uncharacterized protein YdgA (DUF945 family)
MFSHSLKKHFRLAVMASALLALNSTACADDTPQSAAEAFPVLTVLQKAGEEYSKAFRDQHDAIKVLDAQAKFEYSPALQEQLLAIFGSTNPLRLLRTGVTKTEIQYGASLKPFTYQAKDESTVSAGPVEVKVAIDKRGRKMKVSGTLASFEASDEFTAKDVRLSADMAKAVDQLWYGVAQLQVDSMLFKGAWSASDNVKVGDKNVAAAKVGTPEGSKQAMRVDGTTIKVAMRHHGKLADIGYDFGVKSMATQGFSLERLHMAMRFQNMDASVFKDIQKDTEKLDVSTMSEQQKVDIGMNYIRRFGVAMLQPGSAIVFDDISGSYHGATTSVKGRISFDKLKASELNDPMAWKNKLELQFDVRFPMAIVDEICRSVAEQQLKAQANGAQVDPEVVGKVAKEISALVVGKSVGEGYAKLVNRELRTTIVMRNGVLTANGKVLEVPAPVATGASPEAAQAPAPEAAPAAAPAAAPEPATK